MYTKKYVWGTQREKGECVFNNEITAQHEIFSSSIMQHRIAVKTWRKKFKRKKRKKISRTWVVWNPVTTGSYRLIMKRQGKPRWERERVRVSERERERERERKKEAKLLEMEHVPQFQRGLSSLIVILIYHCLLRRSLILRSKSL